MHWHTSKRKEDNRGTQFPTINDVGKYKRIQEREAKT